MGIAHKIKITKCKARGKSWLCIDIHFEEGSINISPYKNGCSIISPLATDLYLTSYPTTKEL